MTRQADDIVRDGKKKRQRTRYVAARPLRSNELSEVVENTVRATLEAMHPLGSSYFPLALLASGAVPIAGFAGGAASAIGLSSAPTLGALALGALGSSDLVAQTRERQPRRHGDIKDAAIDIFGDVDEVESWFEAPNANFGGRSPSAEIDAGGIANVQHVLDSLRYIGVS